MGLPAARIGDQCAHGGVIVTGYPTVLIGGMPASRVTDMHVCPAFTGLVPHVGGPIIFGVPTVITGQMPQARVSSLAICVGPPDNVVKGESTVLVGDGAPGAGGGGVAGLMGMIMSAVVALFSPPYPRSELQPDGSIVTTFSENVLVKGTAMEQAATVMQLEAVKAGDGGPEFFDALAERDQPVTLQVIGNPARGRELYQGPQTYQNCAPQSAQQIIRQAKGVDNNEATMERVANYPTRSEYSRDDGTPVSGVATILENGGVAAHEEPGNTDNVDDALANGQGVISLHDAGTLWDDPSSKGSGHAVFTTGAVQDEQGNTLAYTTNDTGLGQNGRVIPADTYRNSMGTYPVITTDDSIW